MCCTPSWRKADWLLVVIVHVMITITGEGDDTVADRNVVDWCSGMLSVATIENVITSTMVETSRHTRLHVKTHILANCLSESEKYKLVQGSVQFCRPPKETVTRGRKKSEQRVAFSFEHCMS